LFSIPHLDGLSSESLRDHFYAWLEEDCPGEIDPSVLDQAYQLSLPRTVFLRALPHAAKVLDVGAGDGSLTVFKEWPLFARRDLALYALSLERGEHFDNYNAYETKNLENDQNIFEGLTFDAMICAHFTEHIADPSTAIAFFERKLRRGGRIYIEWPHPISTRMPKREDLIALGYDISTLNFYDDGSHIQAWEADGLLRDFEGYGFVLEAGGRVHLPWLGSQMRRHSRAEPNVTRLTMGAWAAFGWAQYAILCKS
jgi:SAM-dependent methyltransferase